MYTHKPHTLQTPRFDHLSPRHNYSKHTQAIQIRNPTSTQPLIRNARA